MNKRILYILTGAMLLTVGANAQSSETAEAVKKETKAKAAKKEQKGYNPRGVYRLTQFIYSNGSTAPAPFEQYKICTDSVTWQVHIRNADFHFSDNDKMVMNFTGEEPDAADFRRSRVFDSSRKAFKLKWWSNYENHNLFPNKEWCIEQYEAGTYSKTGKVVMDVLTKPMKSGGNPLVGHWYNIGATRPGDNYSVEQCIADYKAGKYPHRNAFLAFTRTHVLNSEGLVLPVSYSKDGTFVASIDIQGKFVSGEKDFIITYTPNDADDKQSNTFISVWARDTNRDPLLNKITSKAILWRLDNGRIDRKTGKPLDQPDNSEQAAMALVAKQLDPQQADVLKQEMAAPVEAFDRQTDKFHPYYEQMRPMILDGDISEALALLQSLEKTMPGNVCVPYVEARCYKLLGQHKAQQDCLLRTKLLLERVDAVESKSRKDQINYPLAYMRLDVIGQLDGQDQEYIALARSYADKAIGINIKPRFEQKAMEREDQLAGIHYDYDNGAARENEIIQTYRSRLDAMAAQSDTVALAQAIDSLAERYSDCPFVLIDLSIRLALEFPHIPRKTRDESTQRSSINLQHPELVLLERAAPILIERFEKSQTYGNAMKGIHYISSRNPGIIFGKTREKRGEIAERWYKQFHYPYDAYLLYSWNRSYILRAQQNK